jgi:hypothetical protein
VVGDAGSAVSLAFSGFGTRRDDVVAADRPREPLPTWAATTAAAERSAELVAPPLFRQRR